ncbi:Pam3-gp28 family putative phage holin [Profundibacter sp.]
MKDIQPFVRVAIRIAGGIAIGRGWADTETVSLFYDPAFIGAVVVGINELWHLAARRYGWPT